MTTEYETFNDLQVRAVNKIGMYCIAVGAMKELAVGEGDFALEGELYLYQEFVDDDADYDSRMHALYDQIAAADKDIPPYEDLSDYDGLIALKAKYHLGKGAHNDKAIIIDEVIPLPIEDQLTFDDDGNIVKASIFDEE